MTLRVWVERSVGLKLRPSAKVKNFPGRGHQFVDVTDEPFPSVTERVVEVIVEATANRGGVQPAVWDGVQREVGPDAGDAGGTDA